MYDYNDEQDEEMNENIDKNPLGLHQTEIIASLALDLLSVSQNIINPVTNEPFKIKFGKICYKNFLSNDFLYANFDNFCIVFSF